MLLFCQYKQLIVQSAGNSIRNTIIKCSSTAVRITCCISTQCDSNFNSWCHRPIHLLNKQFFSRLTRNTGHVRLIPSQAKIQMRYTTTLLQRHLACPGLFIHIHVPRFKKYQSQHAKEELILTVTNQLYSSHEMVRGKHCHLMVCQM